VTSRRQRLGCRVGIAKTFIKGLELQLSHENQPLLRLFRTQYSLVETVAFWGRISRSQSRFLRPDDSYASSYNSSHWADPPLIIRDDFSGGALAGFLR
jgi:hypothetical protein